MNLKNIFKNVFDEGTEEFEILKDAYELIVSSGMVIHSEFKQTMILADASKVKLATLYYMISTQISEIRSSYEKTYNEIYIKLVKMERPSQHAIETEIKQVYPDYLVACNKIEKFEQVKELITMYIKSIDSIKQTAMEMLRDSRRID